MCNFWTRRSRVRLDNAKGKRRFEPKNLSPWKCRSVASAFFCFARDRTVRQRIPRPFFLFSCLHCNKRLRTIPTNKSLPCRPHVAVDGPERQPAGRPLQLRRYVSDRPDLLRECLAWLRKNKHISPPAPKAAPSSASTRKTRIISSRGGSASGIITRDLPEYKLVWDFMESKGWTWTSFDSVIGPGHDNPVKQADVSLRGYF